jgi:hypothetical protein
MKWIPLKFGLVTHRSLFFVPIVYLYISTNEKEISCHFKTIYWYFLPKGHNEQESKNANTNAPPPGPLDREQQRKNLLSNGIS